MDFTLRAPEPADVETLAQLHTRCWKQSYANQLPADYFTPEQLESRRTLWGRLLADQNPALRRVVAESQGELVGFALAGPGLDGEDRLQLYSLYLLAQCHGSGIGQGLLDAVLGDEPAVLWVARGNPRATAFYRRNGFAFDGAEKTDPGLPQMIELRMLR
ncbi:GNAT family N-acetyltransferase [Arthrobacter sp. MYb211]|uniref:GNAT family N-acetyltransferase n=1 Tax=unclassified Arthrobacter TaxID=235627 RepID=UPI000CFB7EA7|nr:MULTISPECIES: GNAT family N-acetyltransferase [unclassified Arthrobacter]PRA13984.1 GNAT family N-acetyltransferase [Arthrobacter sp. MYb221]PRC09355.1 GNAT family N-acetyltransferase [Arthrobacter sp. MYb211]